MAEYIDVNLLGECDTCRYYVNRKCTTFCDSGESYSPAISKLPIVDVAEVVRCKDCINRNTEDCAMYYQCNCGEQHTWESDNDYCSWGERKTEDTDD